MAGFGKRSKLKDLLTFGKPKTPGYGISSDFYLSVLSPTAVLPSIEQILHPEGRGQAVVGFGAPLSSSKNKSDLARPLERGGYVCASPDRKSILKLLVIPRDEAGFDPQAYLRSAFAASLDADARARIAATWTLLQMSFQAHDPMVYPSLDFLLDVASRIGGLTDGIVADPLSQMYRLPGELRTRPPIPGPVDARNFVAVALRDSKQGQHAYTLGMHKFALPEFEMYGMTASYPSIAAFLVGLAQTVLVDGPLTTGAVVGSARLPMEVSPGGLDRSMWEGVECHELVPSRGHTIDQALQAWSDECGLA